MLFTLKPQTTTTHARTDKGHEGYILNAFPAPDLTHFSPEMRRIAENLCLKIKKTSAFFS